ncbi:MAG TPA: family 78 glycoside hydrolase catalytic domain [Candidatus Hydrogenedens sp.]|nr:family 78 glycoside hydrolase catalytic domain [Candidatus Hydrogenedens sp.]
MSSLSFMFLISLILSYPPPVNPFGTAQLIIDPRMKNIEYKDYFLVERKDNFIKANPHLIHTLFRKKFNLEGLPKHAELFITADDYFRLYINGEYALEGPTTGYPYAYPYHKFDLTPYLKAGPNVIAIHTYYRGLINRVCVSGDNRSGLLFRLIITDKQGKTIEILSDNISWKCYPLDAFSFTETTGYETQFLENIDMQKYPQDWKNLDYDDSQWVNPEVGKNDYTFAELAVKPLEIHNIAPIQHKKFSANNHFFDFGREVVGYTRIKTKGEAGKKIIVLHGEELDENGHVRWQMRANCKYREEVILSGKEDIIPFYEYRAFRYIEIEDAPEDMTVWVEERHYPYDTSKVLFLSTDNELRKIWDMCSLGVRLCSQEGFVDCPSREKGQYLGDAVITSRSFMWLTGDTSLTKKALTDFYLSSKIDAGLLAVAPSGFIQEFAEYSLQFPLMLWEYYQHSGDTEFLKTMAIECLPQLLKYFSKYENKDSLLTSTGTKPILIDWPKNLRDNFDYDYALKKPNAVVNAFYYGAIKKTLEILNVLGMEDVYLKEKSEKIFESYQNAFLDPEKKLYKDAPGSNHYSLHSNAIPLFFGLVHNEEVKQNIFKFIEQKGLSCGVYIASYVIEACFKEGNPNLGWKLLTNDTESSWKEMLRQGATSCLEAWKPEMKTNMSWCHAWSSCPIYLISEYILGLQLLKPGWQEIRFAPANIDNLPEMHFIKPLPNGGYCSVNIKNKNYTLTTPGNIKVSTESQQEQTLIVSHSISHQSPRDLTEQEKEILQNYQWKSEVGNNQGIWVSVKQQKLSVIKEGKRIWQVLCSTAEKGTGETKGSEKTPCGWHYVREKIGDNAPWGQIFRNRGPAGIWDKNKIVEESLVLTRILWLDGLEKGKNKGTNTEGEIVDSYQRFIYIHGTNKEDLIGTPATHGCICLTNDDVILLYHLTPIGTKVLITEE